MDGLGGAGHRDRRVGELLADGAGDAVDAQRAGDPHDVADVDGAVVVEPVILLERLHGLRRRARPVLVDDDAVGLAVAERGQHVLELQHVLAVRDGWAQRPPHRQWALQGDDRAPVDLDDRRAGFDHVAWPSAARSACRSRRARAVPASPCPVVPSNDSVRCRSLLLDGRQLRRRGRAVGRRAGLVALPARQHEAGRDGAGDGERGDASDDPAPHVSRPTTVCSVATPASLPAARCRPGSSDRPRPGCTPRRRR